MQVFKGSKKIIGLSKLNSNAIGMDNGEQKEVLQESDFAKNNDDTNNDNDIESPPAFEFQKDDFNWSIHSNNNLDTDDLLVEYKDD